MFARGNVCGQSTQKGAKSKKLYLPKYAVKEKDVTDVQIMMKIKYENVRVNSSSNLGTNIIQEKHL